jgi:ribosomal protein S18 acetylase RimI-like enzyme
MGRSDPAQAGGLEIRAPRIADIAAVAALHYRSWIETYASLLPTQANRLSLAERTAFWDRLLRTRPARMGSLVAVRAGHVVGLVQWETSIPGDPETGELHAIHVAAEERGLGIGRALLRAATSALRKQGMRRAVLWVLEGNASARAFYERQGWRWDGTSLARPLGGFAGFPTVTEVRYALDQAERRQDQQAPRPPWPRRPASRERRPPSARRRRAPPRR